MRLSLNSWFGEIFHAKVRFKMMFNIDCVYRLYVVFILILYPAESTL